MSTAFDTPELARHNFQVDDTPLQASPAAQVECPTAHAPADDTGEWQSELFELFLRNQINLSPVMPIMAILTALTALAWIPPATILAWLAGTVGCHALQLYLSNRYFRQGRSHADRRDWIGIISASELLQGTFWALTLYFFWSPDNQIQNSFIVAALFAVMVVRLLVVSNFMPVLVAGTGVMSIGIAVRCVVDGSMVFFGLAALIIMLEVFFLFVARQLQDTARDRLIFRAQKDELIAALQQERDRAENERRKAETANHAKTAFLANMSHELRTPLNAILGFSEVLSHEMFGPIANTTYKGYAGDIHSSGRYLLGLINDILDLTRIEAGRRDIAEEPVTVLDCLTQTIHLLDAKATEKNIAVTLAVSPTLPKLLCDKRAFNQIAINLLTNAVKFTQRGGQVKISARVQPDGRMAFSVADNGPGIPTHEQKQALSAFTRGTHATKQAIDGAGLGLSIVKGLTEAHGGRVEIRSDVGRGTEVICHFPAARVLSGPRGETLAAPSVGTETQRRLIALTA